MSLRSYIYSLLVASALALTAVAVQSQSACAGEEQSREYMVKAAMIYNFAKFVDWPQDADGAERPLRILILGDDPFGDAMETVQGKTVKGRKVEVVRSRNYRAAARCDILFVCASEAAHIKEILSYTACRPVLTISETDGFAEDGGIVNFRTEDNKVRFDINVKTAECSGLKVSSRLLSLARKVKGN